MKQTLIHAGFVSAINFRDGMRTRASVGRCSDADLEVMFEEGVRFCEQAHTDHDHEVEALTKERDELRAMSNWGDVERAAKIYGGFRAISKGSSIPLWEDLTLAERREFVEVFTTCKGEEGA